MKFFIPKVAVSAMLGLLLISLSCRENSISKEISSNKANDFKIIAYYTGSTGEIDTETVNQLDQIIYSFLHLKGYELEMTPSDSLSLAYLISLKKENPELKVLLSLGGWGGCETCSDVFSKTEGRMTFARSVKELLEEHGADGIDLDWEYPAVRGYPGHSYQPEDRENFTFLIKELRSTLGDRFEISFAAGAFEEFLKKAVEWEKIMPLLDGVNLMSYDLVSGGNPSTGHHTSLYSTLEQVASADRAVKFLDSLGIPKGKIVIGAAFYARVWEKVDSTNSGLYQEGKFKEFILHKDLEAFFKNNDGFERYWDSAARASYSYNKQKGLFATYDDSASIAKKTEYVKENNLKGIMFWQLSGDSEGDGLLDVIDRGKEKHHQ